MQGSVFERLFSVLVSLVPEIERPAEGASYFAPPRIVGDCASYCALSNVSSTSLEVEISQDVLIGGNVVASPWMALRVNLVSRTAELTAIEMPIEDRTEYRRVQSEGAAANSRRSQLQAAAVNNLASMLMLGGEFQPVGQGALEATPAQV